MPKFAEKRLKFTKVVWG